MSIDNLLSCQIVLMPAFGSNLPRLSVIKKKYDSTNFFRVNYNIKPP